MKCLKCNNIKDFIIFGNQDFKIKFKNNCVEKIKKEEFNLSDIYPIICAKCQSEDVDFKYTEIEKIFKIAK